MASTSKFGDGGGAGCPLEETEHQLAVVDHLCVVLQVDVEGVDAIVGGGVVVGIVRGVMVDEIHAAPHKIKDGVMEEGKIEDKLKDQL